MRGITYAAIGILTAALLIAVLPFAYEAQAQAPKASPVDVPQLEFIFEELVTLGTSAHPGKTPFGERNIVPITGGTFSGPNIKGTIMPGGWDWQLATGGCFSLKADYMIKTDDGAIINVLNRGTTCSSKTGSSARLLTTPVFEAPLGRYEWLNGGAYVGTIEVTRVEDKAAVRIRFFKAQ